MKSSESFPKFFLSLKTWVHLAELFKTLVIETSTAVVEFSRCYVCVDNQYDGRTGCATHRFPYRSKEKSPQGNLAFGSYLMNKKWPLEEQFNNHMLRFQQV